MTDTTDVAAEIAAAPLAALNTAEVLDFYCAQQTPPLVRRGSSVHLAGVEREPQVMTLAEFWENFICPHIRSGSLIWHVRLHPRGPMEPGAIGAAVTQYFIRDIDDGYFEYRRGLIVEHAFDALFTFAAEPDCTKKVTEDENAKMTTGRAGRKKLFWDDVMEDLILTLIRDRKGLPGSAGALCNMLSELAQGDKHEGGGAGSARSYLMEQWEFLYDECVQQKRPATKPPAKPHR